MISDWKSGGRGVELFNITPRQVDLQKLDRLWVERENILALSKGLIAILSTQSMVAPNLRPYSIDSRHGYPPDN